MWLSSSGFVKMADASMMADTLFTSSCNFHSRFVWNHVLDGGPEVLRDVAMVTNFGTQFAITGFL